MKNDLKEADIDTIAKIITVRSSDRKLNLCDTGFGKYPDKSVSLVKVCSLISRIPKLFKISKIL
jgi:hypothetical protein